nr:MAG TPA: Pre-mRNA-splicing factor spp42, Pre-mRNA-splicing factor, U2/U5/U6, Lariat, RNA BINDING [Caudoviricetes sp.]
MDFLEMVRMKGYKAFLSDMTTKHGDNTVYEVGKTYTVEGEVKICENGYHFCKKCVDVYDYYSKPCRICEVSVTGAVQTQGNKSVGRRLKILRELTTDEISSLCNSGDRNSGDCNSGDCNSGNWNSGNRNSGYCNTTEPTIRLFDHQTDITFSDFWQSRAYSLLRNIPSDCLTWKYSEYMTDDEKAAHPEYETTGGFLYLEKADRQAWWESLSDESKATITSMPYFDADKFYKCTNIRVEK